MKAPVDLRCQMGAGDVTGVGALVMSLGAANANVIFCRLALASPEELLVLAGSLDCRWRGR